MEAEWLAMRISVQGSTAKCNDLDHVFEILINWNVDDALVNNSAATTEMCCRVSA